MEGGCVGVVMGTRARGGLGLWVGEVGVAVADS